ncbi:hypothetical protein BGI41_05410 [Methanobrevibacter sp. 87.7]|uniref:hypothetical protein n=1 Tax=Methanobrevibacter sp. 87.7 TaxID=387957 RepID=UPI000B51324C|nr:hypothetical protein [Methanobrevibacter sp. 87.7]OWT32860.1 hypothetical protein BGI41_05410 [Methanobrevibacter sp. 87.7]
MKKCKYCETVNEDWARYCNYCGKPLNEEDPNQRYTQEFNSPEYTNPMNYNEDKIILIGYIISIIFGWGWVPLLLINSLSSVGFIGFFGLFLPFYMINSSNPKIKKHGIIQLLICLSGFLIAILLMINMLR